jgi:membrane protease YdiL (CAAX protease family)
VPTGFVRRHALTTFFVGSVGLGSLVTVGALIVPKGAALLPLVAIPVSYVPAALATVLMRATGKPGERAAFRGRLTTFRVGWQRYAIALVSLPLVHLGGVALATMVGGTIPVHAGSLALFPLFLVTSIGEEIGWRGYALPKLQERFSPLTAAMIVGLGWAAFHWVALLANSEAPLAYVLVSTVLFTGLSVIITYVFNDARQAVPVAVLMHAAYNTVSVGIVPLADTGVALPAFTLSAAVAWMAALAMVAVTRSRGGDASQAQLDTAAA